MRGTRGKTIALLGAVQLALIGLVASAGRLAAQVAPEVAALFPAQPAGHLTDVARIVPPDAAGQLESIARDLRTRTGAEVAIVTLPTLQERDPAEVALGILRTWGVGAKAEIGDQTRNAGLVILLVPKPADGGGRGKIRIEVGNGLEGIVTDLAASRVRDQMVPQLARGDYGGGLVTGLRALDQVITAGLDPTKPKPVAARKGPSPLMILLIVLIIVGVLTSVAQTAPGSGTMAGPVGSMPRRRRRGWDGGGPYWGGGGFGGGSGWGGGGGGGGGFTFGGGGGGSGGGAGGDF